MLKVIHFFFCIYYPWQESIITKDGSSVYQTRFCKICNKEQLRWL